ncbi:uncharacterized protein LOC110242438 isoform X2 [Exaiptasia diaphana]|uniref:ShKT domain-containing protein n=1 Tax=Exaiptasia diaphana TaxID=2652724 RepID=A0A913YL99_EXADI|nr:uncharacterized protein LOC110242438 isoform X2 [Exaiptasia diaphana]
MIGKTLVVALILLESFLIAEEWSLETCEVKITKVGCYKDDIVAPRPLPRLIITDRERNIPAWDGHMFDWDKPAKSMRSLACRCAKKVLKMGYSHFSLQYYAECRSGKNANATFSDDGPSDQCFDGSFKSCDQGPNVPCAGAERTNFVYIATEKPTLPTTQATEKPTLPTTKATEKPTLPTTQGPTCLDQYPICSHYAEIGLCTEEFPLVLQYCRKSCQLC